MPFQNENADGQADRAGHTEYQATPTGHIIASQTNDQE